MTDAEQYQHGANAARFDLSRESDVRILRAYDRCYALWRTNHYARGYVETVDRDGRLIPLNRVPLSQRRKRRYRPRGYLR